MTETPTEHLKGPVLVYHGGMHGLGSVWQGLLTVQQRGDSEPCRNTPQVTSLPARPHLQCHQPGEQVLRMGGHGRHFQFKPQLFSCVILMSMPSPDLGLSQLIKEGWISSGHRLIFQLCDLAPLAVPAHTDDPKPVINRSCPFPSPAIARPNPVLLNPLPSWLLSFSLRIYSCSPADWSPCAVLDNCRTSFLAFFFLFLPFNCRL